MIPLGGPTRWPDPSSLDDGGAVEFVLRYEGPLPAAKGKQRHKEIKQNMRHIFRSQLADLWRQEGVLRHHLDEMSTRGTSFGEGTYNPQTCKVTITPGQKAMFRHWHYAHVLQGFRFVPLITHGSGLVCKLDILFLREGHPGALIRSSGDIDNRVKVLFDALRMPHNKDEVPANAPPFTDNFYCLLEDDDLITDINISTGRLLKDPLGGDPRSSDEALVILKVRTGVSQVGIGNMDYLG